MESIEELVARFFDITSGAGERLAEAIEARDAEIRAEARALPRAMLDKLDAMRETYDTAVAILARYGYTVKEDAE